MYTSNKTVYSASNSKKNVQKSVKLFQKERLISDKLTQNQAIELTSIINSYSSDTHLSLK